MYSGLLGDVIILLYQTALDEKWKLSATTMLSQQTHGTTQGSEINIIEQSFAVS